MTKIFIGTSALVGLAIALSAVAQTGATTTPPSSAISCLGAAVNTREQAIDSGMTAYTQAVNSAYSTRATALQRAYSQTGGNGAVKNAVKAAWSAFGSSTKSARQGWQSARNAAWSQFRTSAKACKAPASISDSANVSTEHSGQ